MASPRTVGLSAAENHGEHHYLAHAYLTHAATDRVRRWVEVSRSWTTPHLSGRR